MFPLAALSAALLSTRAFARPTSNFVIEKLESPSVGWVKDSSAYVDKDATTITLKIHLANQNMDKFHERAMNIATPGHAEYGNHLSHREILDMIAPRQESSDLVMNWLNESVLGEEAKVSLLGDYVTVDASVNAVEKLLNAEYSTFLRSGTPEKTLRTLSYSLPSVLTGHVDMVQPTTFFGLQHLRSTISEHHPIDDSEVEMSIDEVQAVLGCTGTRITPTCLANLYNFASAANQSTGLLGVAGFLEEYAIKSDFTTFLNSYAYFSNKAKTFTCTGVNKGTCPNSPAGVEANLDVQYAGILNYLLALPDASLPNTLSISYGDDEATVPVAYVQNACNLFSQLGARGVSILISSGDSGVGSTCKLNRKSSFTTAFPAAWSRGGGGFSEIFARPSYQESTVSNWLTKDTTHSSVAQYFNASGRAYPDISAQATNFVIVVSGGATSVSGTSCSAPTTAGIFQLLNSARIKAGKKGLGFLNPWLYGTVSSGFTDITSGKITGCSGVISNAGFSAVSGWDPATGLGTPDYGKLIAIATATA
ncbi:subtilisin-like protein [Byssothecium circinans]|uniref:Subtilisin-like protein n=1 Tax=Byssothecium circinans TaxID=147558 RepID=A0A6A5TWC0_9PLEO|nr:subtilisin-like protein [Byssothecium circinans]